MIKQVCKKGVTVSCLVNKVLIHLLCKILLVKLASVIVKFSFQNKKKSLIFDYKNLCSWDYKFVVGAVLIRFRTAFFQKTFVKI